MRGTLNNKKRNLKTSLVRIGGTLAVMLLASAPAGAQGPGAPAPSPAPGQDVLVVTSTNNATANEIVVFKLDTSGTPSLSYGDLTLAATSSGIGVPGFSGVAFSE